MCGNSIGGFHRLLLLLGLIERDDVLAHYRVTKIGQAGRVDRGVGEAVLIEGGHGHAEPAQRPPHGVLHLTMVDNGIAPVTRTPQVGIIY